MLAAPTPVYCSGNVFQPSFEKCTVGSKDTGPNVETEHKCPNYQYDRQNAVRMRDHWYHHRGNRLIWKNQLVLH